MYYECRNGSIIEIRNVNSGLVRILYAAKNSGFKHGDEAYLLMVRIEAMNGVILKGGALGEGFDVIGRAPEKLVNAASKIAFVLWYGGIAVSLMVGGWLAVKLFS